MRNVIPCPYSTAESEPCATMLQRSSSGDLIAGVAAHLTTVHGVKEATARLYAERWVRQQP
jgi:hypothetical protein